MANTTHGNFHPTALAAVNEALIVLGQDVTLTELSADSSVAHARKAAFLYEGARIRVLRDHAWAFALRTEETASCLCRPEGAFPFLTARPPRCVRLVSAVSESGRPCRGRLTAEGLETDRPAARLTYVADVADLDRWSPDAYRALVLRLAADLAKPVTGRINERQLQEQAYNEQIEAAKTADARESNARYDAWGENPYIAAMLGAPPDGDFPAAAAPYPFRAPARRPF